MKGIETMQNLGLESVQITVNEVYNHTKRY